MDTETLHAKLRAHFGNLSDDDCEKFYQFSTEKILKEQTLVFSEGEDAAQFFFLTSGSVEVSNSE